MPNTVAAILEYYGPQLASTVKQRLREQGISEEAARQQISRARGSVRRFLPITLPKKESFLYLDKQYNTPEFWSALLEALIDKNTAYGVALQGLIARGGILPAAYFDISSGCPFRAVKKQLNTAFVTERLINIGIIEAVEVEGYGRCVQIVANKGLIVPDTARMSSQIVVEEILAKAVKDWLRKLGFASYNVTETRSLEKQPEFGPFKWDVSGPSYLYPLVSKGTGKPKPGFVVADVFVEGELDERDVKYFLKKCRMARSQKKLPPFMGILVAEHFTREALTLGRQEGLMLATPGNLFGAAVAGALKALLDTLKNAAAIAAANPAKINELFSALGSIEGAGSNLRGALFNLIVGHLALMDKGGSIDIGKKVYDRNDPTRKAEIDVLDVRRNGNEISVYECKGKLVPVSLEEVETWLTKKVPIIYTALRDEQRFGNAQITFEFWSSSYFEPEALAYLEHRKSSVKKYGISWKSGVEILETARSMRLTPIADMLNEHYLKHPLALDTEEEQKLLPAPPNLLPVKRQDSGEEWGKIVDADLKKLAT